MANVSSDLIWQCTRKHNSFLVKRNGIVLTSEPGNPSNVNSARFSGLANKKTVDVKASKGTVTITMKKAKDQNKPSKALRVVKVNAADPHRVIKTAQKLVKDSFYKPGADRIVATRVGKLAQAAVRANKLAKGKLSVKYGRNAKPFPFTPASKSAKATKTATTSTMDVVDDDAELPALAPAGAVDEMD